MRTVARLPRLRSNTVDVATSGNGRRIAVLRHDAVNGSHGSYFSIFTVESGGAGGRFVWSGLLDGTGFGQPTISLSPNGRTIALGAGEKILMIPFDGGRTRRLRPIDGVCRDPSFSADGRRLLFACLRTPRSSKRGFDVYSMRLGGGSPARLTYNGRVDETAPVLSPDGRRLTYVSHDAHVSDSSYELRVSRVGSEGSRLLAQVTEFTRPQFSPGGRSLVYAVVRNGEEFNRRTYVAFTIRVSGAAKRVLIPPLRAGPLTPQWTRWP